MSIRTSVFAAASLLALSLPALDIAAQVSGVDQQPQPLIVVDGVILGEGLLLNRGSLTALDVVSIQVIKKKNPAVAAYGERGRNGVIIITTRSGTAGRPLSEQQLQWARTLTQFSASARVPDEPPIIIVDGVIVGRVPIKELGIHADEIASVEVIKGAAAISTYGAVAAHGVVLITTKDD